MTPSQNRIEISVKGDTCVLLGVKGLNKLKTVLFANKNVSQIVRHMLYVDTLVHKFRNVYYVYYVLLI